ncbi:hypothetical protein AZE42_11486 [Rhizopogon vesiculosus]|uniref:Uncharacterized protein n=1 Tax=Rhizopogon vesiculosus TaxID=180088 RepID=A0A1J8Q9I7_9AGAM|nr:hypothetical protein AZE42_11486 [Rhizopogon vesiculosus]
MSDVRSAEGAMAAGNWPTLFYEDGVYEPTTEKTKGLFKNHIILQSHSSPTNCTFSSPQAAPPSRHCTSPLPDLTDEDVLMPARPLPTTDKTTPAPPTAKKGGAAPQGHPMQAASSQGIVGLPIFARSSRTMYGIVRPSKASSGLGTLADHDECAIIQHSPTTSLLPKATLHGEPQEHY